MNTTNLLNNKANRLNAYQLSCGYIQMSGDVCLWREHGCYHARKNNKQWKSTHLLKDAQKIFTQMKRE